MQLYEMNWPAVEALSKDVPVVWRSDAARGLGLRPALGELHWRLYGWWRGPSGGLGEAIRCSFKR